VTALLLAALFAQPTVVVRPTEERGASPSLMERVGHGLRRLWEKPEPHVAAGNARAAQGDVQGALKEYEKAEVPEHGPQAGAVALNRASALLRAGDAQLAPQALQEANRALAESSPELQPQAAYSAAYALEQAGRPEEAIAAYAHALKLDPGDRDAKVNLELLLRNEQRKQKQPQPGGQQKENKQPQAGKDQQQKQQGEQPQKERQKQAGQDQQQKQEGQQKPQERREQQQGQAAQEPHRDPAGEKEMQGAGARPMDRSEAQRLLDALRAGEKNLQVWRFGKMKAKERRPDVEKDW
jgi:tetratricopeptide (TPR) repeat protein